MYFIDRGTRRTGFLASDDFEEWSEPHWREVPAGMYIIQVDKKIYCYTTEGNSAYLWDDFNPDKGCENRLRKIYDWTIDGTSPPAYIDNSFVQLGRVRGVGSQNTGGLGNDDVDYPDPDNYPEIKEAFEPYSYWNAKDYIQDRRGLSFHYSNDGRGWSSQILADPENIDLPGFRVWKNKNANGTYSGGSGDLRIGGFPFATINAHGRGTSITVGLATGAFGSVAPQTIFLPRGSTSAILLSNANSDGRSDLNAEIDASTVSAFHRIEFSGFYMTNG